ncbi:baculoviral IAP repeat-containing protein 6-like isoform X2 [Mya arenaria]|uniref:baculoviral IAP repeat-containing protein 6-like isoform X2 n=1 Tax=Mya arenaria TaxID=6604 RepID=UPI0022E0A246|nr:baculoviral IAP repeat-containing protein 6-like isoform X2 [Mya arenaria]
MASAGKHQWFVGEDGCIPIEEPACNVTYHLALNSIIVTTEEPAIKIYDVTSGSVLQKSDLSAGAGERVNTVYLPEKNRMVFCNSQAIGVRHDLQGVLLADTALQMPLLSHDKNVRLELPLAEASQFLKSVLGADLPCNNETSAVTTELQKQIEQVKEATRGNHKTAKWATVCLDLPYHALRTVSTCLVTELKRINVFSQGLSIASAVADRLGYLLPSNEESLTCGGGQVERSAMYSEAARRDTFTKWPHMNYKWALPDPMAQAGFYHQPNMSGDDRALCFTCNVCLVCWEPTDEPWSEHERHSPSCPFVKGEHTQNVPLSVTYATQPALPHSTTGENITCMSSTISEDYVATSTHHGNVVIWNLKHKLKRHCQFVLDPTETVVAVKTGLLVDRQDIDPTDEGHSMVDSLEITSPSQSQSQPALSSTDNVDAKVGVTSSVSFSMGEDGTATQQGLQEVPLNDKSETVNESGAFTRPNEDVEVTSMCIVEKPEPDILDNQPARRGSGKKHGQARVKKRPIQPSLICGVSLRCPKFNSNCDDRTADVQSDVLLMNKVNESKSGETSPQIITDNELAHSESDSDILASQTNFLPFLLVVAVREETTRKISKQPSMDSLKPSTSSSNMIPNLTSMSMNQPDWTMLDMYDMDPDVQIVKVVPGPKGALSTSSPTEGISKVEEMDTNSSPSVNFPESAIKRFSGPQAGNVLQCVAMPVDLQQENLQVSSICASLDRQHLIVVLTPRKQCSSLRPAMASSWSCEQTQSSEISSSDPSLPAIDSQSEITESSKSASGDILEFSDSQEENFNTNTCSVTKSDSGSSHGCILIYRFSYDCDTHYATLEETPVVVRHVDACDLGIKTVYVLPAEVCERTEDEEVIMCEDEIYVPAPSVTSLQSGCGWGSDLFGQLAVIYKSGRMSILNVPDLSLLANIELTGEEKFVDVTFCSGIDRLCACTSHGKLYFYQVSEDVPDQSDSAVEGDLTPTSDMPDPLGTCEGSRSDDPNQSPRNSVSEMLAKQQVSFESLSQLYQLTQFENLMPRFTATVPPCWTEMQQEQQQRRHPQHLQHQGEATQHTRTFKLQPDSTTWDEHLFEIVLPRVCCVGHLDVKFTINPLCPLTPDIQMTLLKQNINSIGRQSKSDSTPVDSKINFHISPPPAAQEAANSAEAAVNNVLDPQFLEKHHAEIVCGPVNISDCLDLSGNGGLVTLTSPQLLMARPRAFLLHIKGFPSKYVEEKGTAEKTKDLKKKRLLAEKKTIKSLLHSYTTSSAKAKIENLRGCDWLSEVSITIRKTRKTNIYKERHQRNCMVEQTSFHESLLSVVALDEGSLLTGVSPDHVQNMCLDILTWITSVQMNDPDHRIEMKCILTSIQPKLRQIIQACFIQGSRSTAHKCARLLSQCMQYSKISADPDMATMFSVALLEGLLDCLPLLLCTYSAGGLKWFFTLLDRVKCMDVGGTSARCAELLGMVAKQFQERSSPVHAVLKARYGLNGHPFEVDMFDMELPQAMRQVIPGSQPVSSTYIGMVGAVNTTSTSQGTGQHSDDLDFNEFFNSPPEKSSKSSMEQARNQVLGMLEVEPLHFTCHSTSDGTKMERLDSVGTVSSSSSVINTFGQGPASSVGMSSSLNIPSLIEATSSSPMAYVPPTMSSSLPMYSFPSALAASKQLQDQTSKKYQSVKHKIMYLKQMLNEVNKNILPSAQGAPGGSAELMPSTPKTTPQVMTPPLTPPNEAWQQIFMSGEKMDMPKMTGSPRPTLSAVPTTHSLLQPPPPQVLVIERIYSGARRFVILDFGKPILLTDVIIPMCSDLASLSIDVWVKGEETDGQRLIVASDIGYRSLVMNNIMPSPVCRYLKITTIGRYGSGTTRSKIPVGAFYGHSYILPWEWSTRSEGAGLLDFPAQSQLLSQLGSFMSLLEDIQCRYSLAKARLGGLLQTVEGQQLPNQHTQYFLKRAKNNDEDNNIAQAYNECLQLQLQQNLAMRAIDRLQSAIGLRVPQVSFLDNPAVLVRQACTDKLRCLMESLLETVISLTHTSPSIPKTPATLFTCMDHQACESVFRHLCLSGTPRLQVLTGMMLVRVCGTQPWFGEFLGNMLQQYFNSEAGQVFSQDRVFVLLTAMGQRALQGSCASNIMESLLVMLARVLSPIFSQTHGVTSPSGHLDLTLIGWILLFMCRNLDNTVATNVNVEEQGAAAAASTSRKSQGSNLSNRWNFIAANSNVKSNLSKNQSVRQYRKSLHKRLLHHKQKLMDIEHMKKNFLSSEQGGASLNKQQGKTFWKELTQFASKASPSVSQHLKDIIQIRKTDAEMLRKLPRTDSSRLTGDDRDGAECEGDTVLILPKERCLPVVHGLMALLLGMDFTCNVDLFLITCKVVARVCISTRPAITLTEAMSQDQLERLIMLAANLEFNHGNITWGGPWAGHALTCLLQDILEGERVFPVSQFEGMTDDDMSGQVTGDSLSFSMDLGDLDSTGDTGQDGTVNESLTSSTIDASDLQDSSLNDQGTYASLMSSIKEEEDDSFDKGSSMMVNMLLEDDEDMEMPAKLHAYVTGESLQPPITNGTTNIPMMMDEEKAFKPKTSKEMIAAKAMAVFGSTGYNTGYNTKLIPMASKAAQNTANTAVANSTPGQGLSTALDARLELGLETHSELRLRMMLSLQTDALQNAMYSPLPLPPGDTSSGSQSRASPMDGDLGPDTASSIQQQSSHEMLSQAYDELFSQRILQRVNLDSLLQLWLTLNEELPLDSGDPQTTFDPSRAPAIPLSVTSVTNLLACVAGMQSLSVRTFVLVFQSLTLLANLKIGQDEQRSMVIVMMADGNLMSIITSFLSGTSLNVPASTFDSNSQVGPSAVKAFHLFIQRLGVCICGEEHVHNLREIMLKLVYTLSTERGAFHSNLGPLDAQCMFLEFVLGLSFEQVDINNAISVIESVSILVNRHILCQERVFCKSSSDNCVNARSCFGGLFASLLRGGESTSKNGDYNRDILVCSLMKLVNKLLQVIFPSRHGGRVPAGVDGLGESHTGSTSRGVPDSAKISQALATSTPRSASLVGQSDEEKAGQAAQGADSVPVASPPQTDEQKTENAQSQASQDRANQEGTSINLCDIILERRNIMCNFIQALSYCNSSTMAMILGSSGMPSNMQESFTGGDPISVGDGIYQILGTLSRQCSDSRCLMDALFLYLSGNFTNPGSQGLCRLSEPLLWFILKVLDSPKMLKMFLDKGGVEVVCKNFVNCNSRIISTSPSLISTIMQNMNGQQNADKRKKWDSAESAEGLQNFAPLGTIVSCSPTASPADVLILSTPQHRRARSAPWSYHFYPEEAWVDLKITLPFAVLVKEVQIQPHSPALSTCPAYVSLEASQDGVTTFPLCAPVNTSSLVFIKLQLQRPEVVKSVTIRLHRARDSMTIGLSQILLMGYSAFGEVGYKTNNLFLPTEDFVSRSSVGWIRLLHHCLVSQKELEGQVADAASPTPGLLNTCTALLVSPISLVYNPNIEAVLLKLGLHSGEMGLALIDYLLRSNGHVTDTDVSCQYLGKLGGVANESTVEILYKLATVQDRWTYDRLKAMLQWLGDSARVALQRKATFSDDGFRPTPYQMSGLSLPGPAPLHVHCIATALWHSCETRVDYNLGQLVTKDLVSSLYEWSTVLNTDSLLKRSVDYVLCSVCHICPDAFTRIMEWMGIVITPEYGLTASISDDRKDSSHYQDSMTDDSKEANSARAQNGNDEDIEAIDIESSNPVILQDFGHMCLDEAHLRTLALACQSSLATKQLLESGFPAVLAQGLFEFCNRVISNFADSWSQPEGISDTCKSMSGTSGDTANSSATLNNLTVSADMVSAVLNFFSEVSASSAMKDWLGGADGNIFWPVLLTMLCDTTLHTPIAVSAFPQKFELISADERASIETASVAFFRSLISNHIPNQMLFAKVLYDVIKEQGATNNKSGMGVCPLSGYTRRLFLQVLLEDEMILVALRSGPSNYLIHAPPSPAILQHPQFGAGRRFRTLRANINITIGELLSKISDTPSLAAQVLDIGKGKKSDESKESSTCQIGLELVDVIENIAVGKTDSGEAYSGLGSQSSGNKSVLPPRPPTRRGRNEPTPTKLNMPLLTVTHKLLPSTKGLPYELTLSQLCNVLQEQGLPYGENVLDFHLSFNSTTNQQDSQPDLTDNADEVPDEVLLTSPMYPTPLQVFASVGGLALLAEHLPLLYPEISRQIASPVTSGETTPNMTNGADNDWVTVDNYPDPDFYSLYEPVSPAPQASRVHHLSNLSIPPHSLVAFGLFLRLPGYAEVLLKERKKAQCLLRLMLGVTDDGSGGQILTSPIANSLPTLPFIVLKTLFDSTPLTTDDGVLLRRMCLENGALHLILACLSVLSHHPPRITVPGFQQETYTVLSAMQAPTAPVTTTAPTTSAEKSQQFWAKGTGFGTGSTTSSWDAEQALIRQRSEEEHVTCLLQVLASYINPGGEMPESFSSEDYEASPENSLLPDVVLDMLSQSCLVPALSSYLRNDSVLDMARHVPLYRALLQLLRGISVCPALVPLLLRLDREKTDNGNGATAVGELLEKMRACVDTYASRLKSNKGKMVGTKEEEEENEGLAMLIPDIQNTATIVHTATARITQHHDFSEEEEVEEEGAGVGSQDVDQIYLTEISNLQFGQYEMVEEDGPGIKFTIKHHYESQVKAAGEIKNPTRIRRLAQEAVTLSTSLPLSVSSSVFVRCDEERLDIMKVLITGPEDTPYANGCFEFDVYFPQDYPNAPPNINLETTGNRAVRFNPNLYNDGKVCLSVLNTWHGRPEEKWNSQTSSFLQVLVSIQSLILVSEPYFNEPGYERSRGTASGNASSREYDANIRQATVKWAILEQLKNPSPCFREVVHKHLWLKRHKVLKQCEDWIAEMEGFASDKRTGRTISHSTMALIKHYNQLREEFAKMKPPEGLEYFERQDHKHGDPSQDRDKTKTGGSRSEPGTEVSNVTAEGTKSLPADNTAGHSGGKGHEAADGQSSSDGTSPESATSTGPQGASDTATGPPGATNKGPLVTAGTAPSNGTSSSEGVVANELVFSQDANDNNAYELAPSANC